MISETNQLKKLLPMLIIIQFDFKLIWHDTRAKTDRLLFKNDVIVKAVNGEKRSTNISLTSKQAPTI